MRIHKFSAGWSDKKANDIVNYFVTEGEAGGFQVMESPLPMSSTVAHAQLNKQNIKAGKPRYEGNILSVRLDLGSGRVYLPEVAEHARGLQEGGTIDSMVKAVILKAQKKYGSLPLAKPILGDPYTVIRVRKVSDFPSSTKFIQDHLKEESLSDTFVDLPVVEANLAMMPSTVESLPRYKAFPRLSGSYVWPEETKSVRFVVRKETGGSCQEIEVHSQETPLIIVNTSPASKVGEADKERVVITSYKDFSTRGATSGFLTPAGKYTIKYLLYMGYSFRDICEAMMSDKDLANFEDIIYKGSYLMSAAAELSKSGYVNPARNYTYYAFQIDYNDFPYKFKLQTEDPYSPQGQVNVFVVVHFNLKNGWLVFRTPLYLSDAVCQKILMAKSTVVRADYVPDGDKIATDEPPARLVGISPVSAKMIQKDLVNRGLRPAGKDAPFKELDRTEAMFQKRMVSDYYQTTDIIERIIKGLKASGKNVEFHDMPVIVGPWSQVLPIEGGYTNMKKIQEQKVKLPLQPIPGSDWAVMPPFIMIDNAKNSSVADQSHIVIHEYRHHINEQLGVESPNYDVMSESKDLEEAIQKRLFYLASPDERESHIEQMQQLLGVGYTKGKVITYFLGEPVSEANMRVAMKYLELANEAEKRLKAGQEENIHDEIAERLLSGIMGEDEPNT